MMFKKATDPPVTVSVPQDDPTSIGNLLQTTGIITKEQLVKALEYKRSHPHVRLGDAIVKLGMTTRQFLENVVAHQRAVRTSDETRTAAVLDRMTAVTDQTTQLKRSIEDLDEMSKQLLDKLK